MNRSAHHSTARTTPRATACVLLSAAGIGGVFGIGGTTAQADIVNSYAFDAVTHNSSAASRIAVANQLLVTVSAPSATSDYAVFTFRNLVGFASNLSEIRFDGGACISDLSLEAQSGASFGNDTVNQGAVSPNPSPNLQDFAGPAPGDTTTRLCITDDNGLDALSDWITVRVSFTGRTFADVASAMANPSGAAWFRIFAQVRSIGDDAQTDGFSNGAMRSGPLTLVPLPVAVWPGLATVGGVIGFNIFPRRRAAIV